jgi:hypothetical protein
MDVDKDKASSEAAEAKATDEPVKEATTEEKENDAPAPVETTGDVTTESKAEDVAMAEA